MRHHQYFVYILTNCSRHPLYTGVTNSLENRHWQHGNPQSWEGSYAQQYQLDRLAYFEQFQYVKNAIAREKQIKRWSRVKKIALIERINPKWDDLSRTWRNLPNSVDELPEIFKPWSLDSTSFRSG